MLVDVLGFIGFLFFIVGAGFADSNSAVPYVMFGIGLVMLLIAAHESGVMKRWVTSVLKKLD